MLGIILCENNNFLLSFNNGDCYLSYLYNFLNKICSKIIIITNPENIKFVKYVINDDISIINDKKLIKNEDYNLAIVINVNSIIDNINFDIKDEYKGSIISINNLDSIWIFKKEIEDIFINNDFSNHEHLFLRENIMRF